MKTFVLVLVALLGCVWATEPKRNRFRVVLPNITTVDSESEISDFLNYGCESLIEIKNEAQKEFRIECKSADDATKSVRVSPGHSYLFSFRPLLDGSSEYWCTLLYQQMWSRFDAYSEHKHPYLCPGKRVYRYSVKHDGVYVQPSSDEEDNVKIRALFRGHNKFQLWDQFDEDTGTPDGLLMKGFVDGGMCSDLPDHFDEKTVAITVCNHQCIFAYKDRRCRGYVQKLQAPEGCHTFPMDDPIIEHVSAIKGC